MVSRLGDECVLQQVKVGSREGLPEAYIKDHIPRVMVPNIGIPYTVPYIHLPRNSLSHARPSPARPASLQTASGPRLYMLNHSLLFKVEPFCSIHRSADKAKEINRYFVFHISSKKQKKEY